MNEPYTIDMASITSGTLEEGHITGQLDLVLGLASVNAGSLDLANLIPITLDQSLSFGAITQEMLGKLLSLHPVSLDGTPLSAADILAKFTETTLSIDQITQGMLIDPANLPGPVLPIGQAFNVADFLQHFDGASQITLADVQPISATELSAPELLVIGVNAIHLAPLQ